MKINNKNINNKNEATIDSGAQKDSEKETVAKHGPIF